MQLKLNILIIKRIKLKQRSVAEIQLINENVCRKVYVKHFSAELNNVFKGLDPVILN